MGRSLLSGGVDCTCPDISRYVYFITDSSDSWDVTSIKRKKKKKKMTLGPARFRSSDWRKLGSCIASGSSWKKPLPAFESSGNLVVVVVELNGAAHAGSERGESNENICYAQRATWKIYDAFCGEREERKLRLWRLDSNTLNLISSSCYNPRWVRPFPRALQASSPPSLYTSL